MKRSIFATPYALWMAIFTILPVVFVAYYAFTDKTSALSMANWENFFTPGNLQTMWVSVYLALQCTLICLIVGYPAAYFLASRDFSKNRTLFVLILLPMWMNFLLRTYAMRALLLDAGVINTMLEWLGVGRRQLLNTQGAVLLGMVYNFLPFMILPIYTCLRKFDHRVIEAAEDLGANPVQVFLRVTMPLSVPGVVSGITMVFMPAVTTFAISRLLGGGMTYLIGDMIESLFMTFRNWNYGSTISLILMALIIGSIAILRKVDPNNEGGGAW